MCDTKGIIAENRPNLDDDKRKLLAYSNPNNIEGDLRTALRGADVFIGVSVANLLTAEDIRTMAPNAIVFALANPTPEIMPDEARAGGALVVGTGRSDFPNQVNNVLAFPGIFRGALDARAKQITTAMKLAAAYAIAESIADPTAEESIPSSLDASVAQAVAKAGFAAAV